MPSANSRSSEVTLRNVLINIDLARKFVAGASFKDFRADRRTLYATVRCLEIISEASSRLPTNLKARHPHLPWTDIVAAGDMYLYRYRDVRDEAVWQTVQEDLGPLRIVVEQELDRLAKE
jgi:uncharacterized protein with HEPN domain